MNKGSLKHYYRVICYAYCRTYVRSVSTNEESLKVIIEAAQRVLMRIKLQLRDTVTGI